jgi:hypothetical protein
MKINIDYSVGCVDVRNVSYIAVRPFRLSRRAAPGLIPISPIRGSPTVKMTLKSLVILAVLLVVWHGSKAMAEDSVLDEFEELQGWTVIGSPGVRVEFAHDAGYSGMGLRVDFDFQGHGGHLMVRKSFPLKLPDNYAFSFMLRGEAPANNFEFKCLVAGTA